MDDRTTKARILDRGYQLAGLYGLESLTIGRLVGDLAMSKAGIYGHFGSKQALQLQTIRYARATFLQDVITPAGAAPDGIPRLWAMCAAVLSYSAETGLHGGDFWVTWSSTNTPTAAARFGTVDATMNGWMRQLADLLSAGSTLGQLAPCDPVQRQHTNDRMHRLAVWTTGRTARILTAATSWPGSTAWNPSRSAGWRMSWP